MVRSQEIDHAGERGFTFQARQVMESFFDLPEATRASLWESIDRGDHDNNNDDKLPW